jgi:SAM-dependent methyltransferase
VAHCPMKFKFVRDKFHAHPPRVLDIGCGNHSPTLTKRWFPGCYYAGADIQTYNNGDQDLAAIDHFYPVAPDGSGYDSIPDDSFDLVILNHVVEHMADPAPVLAKLCSKLRSGGYIWIAFPSLRSLSLPSSCDETLQFCDDSTHIHIPDIREIGNVLLANQVRILHAGHSREGFFTTLADIVKLAKRILKRLFTGQFSGKGMWYLLGFEDHVFGQRRQDGLRASSPGPLGV